MQGEGEDRGTADAAEARPGSPDLSLGRIFVMDETRIAPAFNALAVPRVDKTLRTERAELILMLCKDLGRVLPKQQGTQTELGAGISEKPGLGGGLAMEKVGRGALHPPRACQGHGGGLGLGR